MQSNTQPQLQPHEFKPGTSGNRSGKTRTDRRYAAYLDVFQGVHGRKPNPIENTSLHNAAALAARIEGNRIPIEEQVRAGNLLARLVEKLGLDRAPAPAAPKTPLQSLQEHCDRIGEQSR